MICFIAAFPDGILLNHQTNDSENPRRKLSQLQYFQMAVSDCHQAIQATLNRESSDLSGDVVLVAESYGAFIAASLAAKYPAWHKTLILKNPLVDLSATAQSDQLLYWDAIQ